MFQARKKRQKLGVVNWKESAAIFGFDPIGPGSRNISWCPVWSVGETECGMCGRVRLCRRRETRASSQCSLRGLKRIKSAFRIRIGQPPLGKKGYVPTSDAFYPARKAMANKRSPAATPIASPRYVRLLATAERVASSLLGALRRSSGRPNTIIRTRPPLNERDLPSFVRVLLIRASHPLLQLPVSAAFASRRLSKPLKYSWWVRNLAGVVPIGLHPMSQSI